MEQNPSSEVNTHSASQEFPLLLWDSKVYYRVSRTRHCSTILHRG